MSGIIEAENYQSLLSEIKLEIKSAQQKAINSVNIQMLMLYFSIGKRINAKQNELGWGAKVIDKLSFDISNEIPEIKGFSTRNIKRMLTFYREYATQSFKDPYIFDFFTIEEPFRERELELNLVKNMEKFLLELGSGFAFVGRQYKLEVKMSSGMRSDTLVI